MDNHTHENVKEFYGDAAEKPQEDLCCPSSYPSQNIDHIPQEVLDRFYGCGSPIIVAEIKIGENILDLGSGAGIDCFIASKLVGEKGTVIGVDMTDNMLKIANESNRTVSENLGYNNVEFRKGYLEEIPALEESIDLVTSNCVINLSPNKRKVFSDIWRILKNNGRLVVSDIVSDIETTEEIKKNKLLWGECLAGALTENQFLFGLEQSGFYGIEILNKEYWKKINNINFFSLTVRAFKYNKSTNCNFLGHKAIYNGPFKVIIDDDGHVFTRSQEVEICTDTLNKLMASPYKNSFTIIEPTGLTGDMSCCNNETATCC
jgi:SAM-dependent methyltransferase